MDKLTYIICIAFILLCFSCEKRGTNQKTQIQFKSDSKELSPIFLNVIDSFIKTIENPEYDVRIDIFSNVGDIYFYIKDIPLGKKQTSSHFLYYKGKKIFIYTVLDELMMDRSLCSENIYTSYTHQWYVELKENIEWGESKPAVKEHVIQRIDTSGMSIYGIKFAEPVIKDEEH